MVKKNYDDRLSQFHLKWNVTDRQTDRQTDGRTDIIAISISRDKNVKMGISAV